MNRDYKKCKNSVGWIEGQKQSKKTVLFKHLKLVDEYNKNPKICKNCINSIPYNKRANVFCSHSCRAKYHNNLKYKIDNVCKQCLKQKQNPKSVVFCSRKCHKVYVFTKNLEKWKSGFEELSLASYIRRYIKTKFNNKCCKCGWCEINPTTGKVPVEINHIDGNHKNNKEEKLSLYYLKLKFLYLLQAIVPLQRPSS